VSCNQGRGGEGEVRDRERERDPERALHQTFLSYLAPSPHSPRQSFLLSLNSVRAKNGSKPKL